MPVFRIEIVDGSRQAAAARDEALVLELREAGLAQLKHVRSSRLFFLEGTLTCPAAEEIAHGLLVDPITETAAVLAENDQPTGASSELSVEVHPKPGVMDPVAESTLAELRAEGHAVDLVRTARRYVLTGPIRGSDVLAAVARVLSNDCIEQVVLGTAGVRPALKPPVFDFELRHVAVRELNATGLQALSRDSHLFLSLGEMQAIQRHFREQGRDPTDLELETIAQTWSEHCVHKTLKSAIVYRGAPMGGTGRESPIEIRYENLLKDTIARATDELVADGRGPQCLSVFVDNAGVIAFDDDFGIAFKVETHNHPSAIEPYGGAATGIGGCIRDVMGCGLGARPIANTDVFCVAPSDWPHDKLPRGVLHPRRILRGVVRGVSDYGNRMGIPTVNGAVCFDPRYLGNPLVYCGCVGLIPRDKVHKGARVGDLVVVIGGRTGRDGIHGATFSSAELTDTHADEFSHAVQIGNAITEKRCLDAILRARDHESGCLYTAITDCGAGGLSSAVGEMSEAVGALVDLENVPLKYAGLRYDEIWISEAQERMVLAVPPDNIDRFMEIMRQEEVEATVIGRFGGDSSGTARLIVRYDGAVVGDLDMRFLHHGLPKRERIAEWWPEDGERRSDRATKRRRGLEPKAVLSRLKSLLRSPNVGSKEWIIRQYDHEVQGGSVVKPLGGPGNGPADAAVLRPRLDSARGIALGCGNTAHLSDVDPYWMAVASIDEALRNVVAVGGDPARTAVLDNFCWGSCDEPRQLGTIVRACQGCCDAARAYGTPFISGKDSLNNEFALHVADVAELLEIMERYAKCEQRGFPDARRVFEVAAQRIRQSRRLSIPGTLLISAVSLIDDVGICVTSDLKQAGNRLCLVGGLPQMEFSLAEAASVHAAVADAIRRGLIVACHDSSDGGWLVAIAEMAIAGNRGVELAVSNPPRIAPFEECCAAYLVETADPQALETRLTDRNLRCHPLGVVRDDDTFTWEGQAATLTELRAAWGS
ncbi:MAG: phosphoribosylformylglycinamidine synthase [Planctomycetes bacterium]|nr:phosphoribosylformylglycinamidine synthase [Planctomycetota bacterium]